MHTRESNASRSDGRWSMCVMHGAICAMAIVTNFMVKSKQFLLLHIVRIYLFFFNLPYAARSSSAVVVVIVVPAVVKWTGSSSCNFHDLEEFALEYIWIHWKIITHIWLFLLIMQMFGICTHTKSFTITQTHTYITIFHLIELIFNWV